MAKDNRGAVQSLPAPIPDGGLVDLARSIFVRVITSDQALAKTPEHLAEMSFERAAAFWAAANKRNPERTA